MLSSKLKVVYHFIMNATYLFNIIKVSLHALDGDLLVGFDLLRLQHL